MARNATERLSQNVSQQQPNGAVQPGTQIATRQRTGIEIKQDNLASLLKRMGPEMGAALPKHMTPERLVRIATTVMRRTPALATCDQNSFLGAVMTCAQLGLEPGPTGQAYLVPYGKECTFILGYKGMLELARRSGQVETIYAEPVYKLDTFSYTKGLDPTITHVPYDGEHEEGSAENPLTHVYAVAKYKSGGYNFVVLSRARVEAIRKRSRASSNGPWVTDYVAMALKTAIRRLATWMPQSVEFQTAIAVDGTQRTEWNNPATIDNLAADPNTIDVEPVSAPPASGGTESVDVEVEDVPDGVDPETGEAEWPDVTPVGGGA